MSFREGREVILVSRFVTAMSDARVYPLSP